MKKFFSTDIINKLLVLTFFLSTVLITFALGVWWRGNFLPKEKETLVEKIIPKPLEAYSIDNLSSTPYPKGLLTFQKNIPTETETKDYSSNLFTFKFKPNPRETKEKITTVLVNTPITENEINKKYPLVFMIRGYVDPSIYTSGVGTRRSAEIFVKNGYITVAPDFLGYGGSDLNSENIFESRFQTYTTVLALLNSLAQVEEWDGKNIFIWAHSNGGQIALTALTVTGKNIPTTLWAPVTAPFPYSILYYTNESADRGKLIRRELANFEDLYDPDNYSFDLYLDQIGKDSLEIDIKVPIQLHQGTADDAIPVEWSKSLKNKLTKLETVEINYFEYLGADHNLQPAWNSVVERDLVFFQKHLQ